jgi:hypothetical protein
MYEEYFEDEDAEYNVQKMEIKTMKLFKGIPKEIRIKESKEQSTTCPGTQMAQRELLPVIVLCDFSNNMQT